MTVIDPRQQPEQEWWKTFHVPEMADLFLERKDDSAFADTLGFLNRELHLASGDHAYDQCCGTGSVGLGLARQGMVVTGADLNSDYIDRASAAVRQYSNANSGLHQPEFFCRDAFEFVPAQPCDGVFNWYSSFGYSSDDSRNAQMLQRAFQSLKPGGWFALDVPNLPFLLRTFRPEMMHEGESQGRKVVLKRRSDVDIQSGLLRQTWVWNIDDGKDGPKVLERHSALRLYLPHQIGQMLNATGFCNMKFFGTLHSEPLTIDSPRLIITAQRPES